MIAFFFFFFSSAGIMLKPVTLRCGHSGFYDCYEKIVATQQQSGRTKGLCAECRYQFGKDELSIHVAMRKLANKLEVTCPNKGCNWNGKFPDAENHGNDCVKRVVSCLNGCAFRSERENIHVHLSSCTKGKVECPQCRKTVERAELSHHGCMYANLPCPLGCETDILM